MSGWVAQNRPEGEREKRERWREREKTSYKRLEMLLIVSLEVLLAPKLPVFDIN